MQASIIREENRSASQRSLFALDALNVSLPEVAAGIGPFLIIWMSTTLGWQADRIGILMGVSGMIGVLAQGPAGALVDRSRNKRWLVFAAAAIISAASLTMMLWPGFGTVLLSQSATGVMGAALGPAVAAISLGMVGRARLERRLGRNASLGAMGNVTMAVVLGVAGFVGGYKLMFVFVIAMTVVTAGCALAIRDGDIDNDVARGADSDISGKAQIESWTRIYSDRRLLILAACAVMFHFANAVLLTLVAQLFAHADRTHATLYLAGAVAVTQIIVVPLGAAIGRAAHRMRRRPVFAIAFLVLPLRCLLYTVGHGPAWLLALQVFDGIGAGIFGVMQVLVIADITRGTGWFNLANGSIGMAVGLGAAMSNAAGGLLVMRAGYNAAFLTMAAIAAIAAILFLWLMPETRRDPKTATGAPIAVEPLAAPLA